MSNDNLDQTGAPREESEQERKARMLKEFVKEFISKHTDRGNASKNRRMIANEVGNELHSIVRDGVAMKVPLWAIALMKLSQVVAQGNRRALKKYQELSEELMPQASRRNGYIFMPPILSMEECIRRYSRPEDLAKMTVEQIRNIR
jgi:hypothetical protein